MNKQKIMSIGAHADDIEIGSGGTLAKFHDQQYEIVYVMSTNNMSGGVQELQADGSIKRWKENGAYRQACLPDANGSPSRSRPQTEANEVGGGLGMRGSTHDFTLNAIMRLKPDRTGLRGAH